MVPSFKLNSKHLLVTGLQHAHKNRADDSLLAGALAETV
jgi:hypothetical protein